MLVGFGAVGVIAGMTLICNMFGKFQRDVKYKVQQRASMQVEGTVVSVKEDLKKNKYKVMIKYEAYEKEYTNEIYVKLDDRRSVGQKVNILVNKVSPNYRIYEDRGDIKLLPEILKDIPKSIGLAVLVAYSFYYLLYGIICMSLLSPLDLQALLKRAIVLGLQMGSIILVFSFIISLLDGAELKFKGVVIIYVIGILLGLILVF